MFYTHVLLSEKDKEFYVGFTEDLRARLEKHKTGKVKSTANRRPLKLIYYEACLHERDAIKREKYFLRILIICVHLCPKKEIPILSLNGVKIDRLDKYFKVV